jgi:hypothetical protein
LNERAASTRHVESGPIHATGRAMAGIDADINARPLLSLSAARAYLEQHTKSRPPYAELLLRQGLAGELIRYCAHEVEVHFPDRGKPRVLARMLVPPPPIAGAGFWKIARFDDSSQLEFIWDRSEAVRTDHAAQMLDGAWREHRIVRLHDVRVPQEDLDVTLQLEGLPVAKATAALSNQNSALADMPSEPPLAEPAVAPAPAPAKPTIARPADVSPAAKSKPRRPRTLLWQRIEAVLRYLYPLGIPSEDRVKRGDLIRAVRRTWNCEKVPNLEKLTLPSRDTVGRVIDDLRSAS